MLLDELHKAVIDLVPHFIGHDSREWTWRDFNREIDSPLVTDIHDLGISRSSSEKFPDELNRLLRRRKADANRLAMSQCV